MDLATVLADKSLLASLSREYELLKATHASIDWQDWIAARLKRAAARRTSGSSTHATFQHQHSGGALQQLKPAPRHANLSLRTPSKASARQSASTSAAHSRRSSAADGGQPQAPVHDAPAQQWQAQDVTNTQLGQQPEPPKPSLVRLHGSSDTRQQDAPVPYARPAPSQLPPHSGPQPHWVAAARLGTALQASRVVSTMHAAAERERRLAAAAAVARQQLDLGLSDVAVLAGACNEQKLQPAAQEQLQQMAKLTREVVEQNQLLQQAMKQQQAQLSEHQGLLTTVLQRAGGGAVFASSSAGAGANTAQPGEQQQQQQQPAACADVAEAVRSPDKLRDQIKDSWLVKKVLQQSPNCKSAQGASGTPAAVPEFIRIAGAAKQLLKRSGTDQQQVGAAAQPKQQQPAAAADSADDSTAADRRKQLKAVLRQLLTKGAVVPLPDGLAGLVEGLKGLQSSSTQQQAQAQAVSAGAQSQAASLVAILQQQQQQTGGTQLSKAQLLVLQRRKAQEEERRRQQEQGDQQEDSSKPGWQSEVYMPPPARMLRVTKGGAADVWNAPDSNAPGSARATPSKPAGSKAQPPRKQPGQRTAAGARTRQPAGRRSGSSSAGGRKSLASVLHGSTWRVDGGLRLQQQEQQQDVSEGRMGAESSRLARVEEATTQVLEAVARLEQRVQQQQQQTPQQQRTVPRRRSITGSPPRRSSVAGSPAKGTMQLQDPAALAGLLSQLERVEQQEMEIREWWFGNSGSAGSGSGTPRAGPAGGSRGAGASGADASAELNSADAGAAAAAANPSSPTAQQAAEQAETMILDDADQQQLALVQLQQQQQYLEGLSHAALEAQQQCALSPAAVKSIKVGRQRFLRHQAMLDGAMHKLGSCGQHGEGVKGDRRGGTTARKSSRAVLQPDQVVEAVADLLVDELLLQEAQDLDGFCDALCDQLIEAEFAEA